jgi:lipoprotein-anchoring transpeptidase ErfK/SrfK
VTGRPRLGLAAGVVVLALAGAGLGRAATSSGEGDPGTATGAAAVLTAPDALDGLVPSLDDATGATGTTGATGATGPAGVRPSAGALAAQALAGRWTARVLRPAILRTWPDGRHVLRVTPRTGYGAHRVYAVAAFRPGWVGVRALQRPNDKLGWIPEDAVRLEPIRTTLVADLSDRELTIRLDGRVRHRVPIGIGRPGSETPLGRYGVTDRLVSPGGPNAVYGCCVVPLTGHQPKLPAGWTGGRRLALHGTPKPGSVGREVSAGCLRMRNEDIERLLTKIPLGATMTVRA